MKKLIQILGVILLLCTTSISYSQWTQIGPTTSSVRSLYVSGDTIFGGSALAGFVYSPDKGVTWCETELGSIGPMAKSNNVLLLGAGSMFRTTDNGLTFTSSSFGSIFSIAIKDNAAISGTGNGMYYSTNAGINWSVSNLNSGIFRGSGISGNAFFAGSTTGIYRSMNGGFSYNLVISPRFVNSILANDSVVYVCSNAGIDFTTNQGQSWNQMPLAMNVKCIAINGTSLFAAGIENSTILKSTNNGQNWTTVLSASGGYINSISAANNYIITSDNNASYVSTNDGVTWTQNNFHFMEAYAVMKTPTALYTSSTVYGAYRSTNNGANWALVGPGYPFGHIRSFGMKDSKIFAGTNGAGIYISTNDGLNWTQTSLNNQTVYSMYTLGSNIYAGTAGSGIYRSTNDGAYWTSVTAAYTIYSITSNGSRLFAGGPWGVSYSDNSTDWNMVTFPVPNIGGVAAIGTNIFAGGTGGIYKSSNNGVNWTLTSFPYPHVNSLAAVNNAVFAGCEKYGFFVSQDLGQTWRNVNGNLGSRISVSRMQISGNDLYAATYYSSVVKVPISGLVGISSPIETELPDNFILEQNYPNPFNPTTKINYNLPVSNYVTLKIYDILGNEVATLVNTRQNAGSYSEDFDAGFFNLSSGVYFYKLQAGEFNETKRMMLVK